MKNAQHAIAIRYGQRAKDMLIDFVNTRSDLEAYKRFKRRWEKADNFKWPGSKRSFEAAQEAVKTIWDGRQRGKEAFLVGLALGLEPSEPSLRSPFYVDWEAGTFFPAPSNLHELVWLTLVQYSQRLGICANVDNQCPTPYFIRRKPDHKYCSTICAAPAQREFKLRWYREHGRELRKHASVRKTASAKKNGKAR